MDAWWRANNYLTVGQIYLLDNPLLREPLTPEHIKPRLLGHWGTSPGPVVRLRARLPADPAHRAGDASTWPGPGHGGPALVAAGYLEGTYTEIYPRGHPGRRRACAGCSGSSPRPGGIPSHVSVPTPGLDPRGRRARLRPGPRVRRRDGQPRPDRARRGRRRRGRDRAAGGLVEGHLLPQPRARRRGAPDPAPQRRQDRRPDRARPQGPRARCASLLEGHGYDVIEVEGDDLPGHAPPVRRRPGARLGVASARSRQRPAAATGTAHARAGR